MDKIVEISANVGCVHNVERCSCAGVDWVTPAPCSRPTGKLNKSLIWPASWAPLTSGGGRWAEHSLHQWSRCQHPVNYSLADINHLKAKSKSCFIIALWSPFQQIIAFYTMLYKYIWVKTRYLSRQIFFFWFFDFFGPIGHRNEGYRHWKCLKTSKNTIFRAPQISQKFLMKIWKSDFFL